MSVLTNILGFVTIGSFISFLVLMGHYHFDSGRTNAQFSNPYLDENLQAVITEQNDQVRGNSRQKWHPFVKTALICYLASFVLTIVSYQLFGV